MTHVDIFFYLYLCCAECRFRINCVEEIFDNLYRTSHELCALFMLCWVLLNPKVAGSSPSQVETFSVLKKLWHFHKNIRSCVENECCCPRTLDISNVNFTSKTPFRSVWAILGDGSPPPPHPISYPRCTLTSSKTMYELYIGQTQCQISQRIPAYWEHSLFIEVPLSVNNGLMVS